MTVTPKLHDQSYPWHHITIIWSLNHTITSLLSYPWQHHTISPWLPKPWLHDTITNDSFPYHVLQPSVVVVELVVTVGVGAVETDTLEAADGRHCNREGPVSGGVTARQLEPFCHYGYWGSTQKGIFLTSYNHWQPSLQVFIRAPWYYEMFETPGWHVLLDISSFWEVPLFVMAHNQGSEIKIWLLAKKIPGKSGSKRP